MGRFNLGSYQPFGKVLSVSSFIPASRGKSMYTLLLPDRLLQHGSLTSCSFFSVSRIKFILISVRIDVYKQRVILHNNFIRCEAGCRNPFFPVFSASYNPLSSQPYRCRGNGALWSVAADRKIPASSGRYFF